MKLIPIFFFLTFLLLDVVGARQKEAYVAIVSEQVCAPSKKDAIIKVNASLRKKTGISSRRLYSKNVYVRHEGDSKRQFCLEAIVTKKGFTNYINDLENERKDLSKRLKTTRGKSKRKEREALKKEIESFNARLEKASRLSTHTLKPITLKAAAKKKRPKKQTKSKVTKRAKKEVNKPSVKLKESAISFKVNGCKGRLTTGCQLSFISKVPTKAKNASYRWDFGDGSSSKRKNPLHSYKKAGDYKVVLHFKGAGYKDKKFSKTIHVLQKKKQKKQTKRHQRLSTPQASFSMKEQVCIKGEKIAFINLAEMKKGQNVQCRWDFGDGRSGQGCRRTHRYKNAGEYTVKLKVSNRDGMSSEIVEKINVMHPAILAAADGTKIKRIERKFGKADRTIIKPGVLTQAYQYGNDWLLVKQNKVLCRIKGTQFKTNLMGNPKNCRWYKKNRPNAIYESTMKP